MSGHLFIVAAPSGAGKTTLVRLLLANDAQLGLSISCTTRAPRPGEEDGRDYHFVGVEDFLDQVGRGEFIEWAEVHGNYYGTLRRTIEEQLQAGRDLVLEIDWQGAQQVRKAGSSSCRRRCRRSRSVWPVVAPTAPRSSPGASPPRGTRCGMWMSSSMLLSTTICSRPLPTSVRWLPPRGSATQTNASAIRRCSRPSFDTDRIRKWHESPLTIA